MPHLTLAAARCAIDATLAAARERKLKPMSVVVVDAGGHPVAFAREDGASYGRFQIAAGKAAGALALGMSSRAIGEMAAERPAFAASLNSLFAPGIIPAAGGVIITSDGDAIGAIGVTGDTSDLDEECARAGLAAARLEARD